MRGSNHEHESRTRNTNSKRRGIRPTDCKPVKTRDRGVAFRKRTRHGIIEMGRGKKGKDAGIFMNPRFLHQAIDLIQDAIYITDASGTIHYLNKKARELFGYGERTSIGKSIGMLFLPDDLTNFLPNILKETQAGGGYEGENLLLDKNNTRVFVKLATALYRDKNRDDEWIVFTIQDITKMKELERNYYEYQRLASLGRMVEEIAHKIRNPVVSIGGFSKRISRKILQGTQLQYFKMIEKEIRRLEGIIDQVQNFASLPRSVYERQDIRKIIEASLEPFSANASQKQVVIDFEVEKPNGNHTAFIDSGLLARALRYILENAIEAIDGEGAIHVKLYSKGDFIGIEISDSGCGISEEHLGAIFDPFFSTKPDKVGISLATAYRIIKEQGGTIQASSQQGKGTCFTIFLPKERRRKIRTQLLS